ncbi:MAG: flagellar export protein FliJ [Pseudomonadales bacterium]|nr:flagellar export protein FliJ [Pseudomonadales bacterium]
MKRSKRMQPVRKLKQQEERTKAQYFAKTQQEVQREQSQLDMLIKYQGDYFNGLSKGRDQPQSVGLSAQQLDKYQLFLARLHTAIENQRQVLVLKEKAMEAARQEWAAAHARLQAMDSLIDKMRDEEARQEDRQEQRMIDDLPLRNNRYD